MNQLIYYLFVAPISRLPLPILYLFSKILFLIFRVLLPYRRKVVRDNINRSFPQFSNQQKLEVERDFYQYFCDLLVESIKNLSMSEREYKQRVKFLDSGLMERLNRENRKVILVGAHYENFEWIISGLTLLIPQKIYGIGMPLSNLFWDKKLTEKRERCGMKVVNSSNYKEILNSDNSGFAVLALSDQSPGNSENAFWTNFLNQSTAVLFGAEFMANEWNAAVVYLKMKQIKKGVYSIEPILLTDQPKSLNFGELTEKHVQLLEQQLQENPAPWLWSHKRWKREIPENLNELKIRQKQRFEKKFR